MIVAASVAPGKRVSKELKGWSPNPVVARGWGVIPQYEKIYRTTDAPIIAYIHDDVECHDPDWHDRVLAEFDDPTVGVVGFGGSLGHGHPDLYKVPYQLNQLGRDRYLSNTLDAEGHGGRFDGACDVATLDGFALIVRRELLNMMGGWQPDLWPPHHVYDYRVTCEAHRHGYRVRLVGIKCHHLGGRTAVTAEYQKWCRTTKWESDVGMHEAGHKMIYDRYRDVLPWVERNINEQERSQSR